MPEIHRQYSFVVRLWTGHSWISAIGGKYLDWTNRISRKLRLPDKARRDGRRNTPHKDDTQPNLLQQQISVRCRDGAQSLHTELSKRLDRAAYFIAVRKPDKLIPAAFAERTEHAVHLLWATARERLILIRRAERQRHQDLLTFQSEHERASDASYPEPWPPRVVLLAVFATVLIETAINSGLFAQVNIDNLKGGILQALAFSAVNVVLGFFGLGLVSARYTVHRKIMSKIAGWSGAITTGATGIVWNLYIAHFRDLISRVPPGTNLYTKPANYLNAFSDMAAGPLNLASWQAVALFFIGLAIFVALAIEGFQRFDDPYPGYGHIDRRHKTAARAYERQKAALWSASVETLKAERRVLQTSLVHEATHVAEIHQIKAEAEGAQREFQESGKALEHAMVELVREYRAINQSVRSAPPPLYFASYESLTVVLPDRSREFADGLAQSEITRDANVAAALETSGMLNQLETRMEIDFIVFVNEIEIEANRRDEQDNGGNIPQTPPPPAPQPGSASAEPAPQSTNGTGGVPVPLGPVIVPSDPD